MLDLRATVAANRVSVLLGVEGMTCSSCSSTVTRCLEGTVGVMSVSVVLTSNSALVTFDPARCSSSALAEAVENIGFGASILDEKEVSPGGDSSGGGAGGSSLKKLTFSVEHIDLGIFNRQSFEAAVLALDGVSEVVISGDEELSGQRRPVPNTSTLRDALASFLPQTALARNSDADDEMLIKVTVDEDKPTGPRALQALCEAHGLVVRLNAMGSFLLSERLLRSQLLETRRYWDLFIFSAIFTLPLVIISMAIPMDMSEESAMIFQAPVVEGLTVFNFVLFLLSTPVQFLSGAKFHLKAAQTVRTGTLGMDFMISTGTMAAYFYSLANTIRGMLTGRPASETDLYFETAAVLITVVLLGKYLEAYARGKTASSIHTLTSLRSVQARLLLAPVSAADGAAAAAEQLIDASLVQRGDVLRLVAGETIPADGEVLSGHVGVDESMLTGESVLVDRATGANAIGGTCVVEGTATMRVTACGDGSVLGTILATVQSATQSKPKIQETADRVSAYFVPAIAFISLVTFFAWFGAAQSGAVPRDSFDKYGSPAEFAFFFALAVWVSACPCAFGLATPTAVLVATGLAAGRGLWIRRGAALQTAAELTAVAFDKTGTLTEGRMKVTDCRFFSYDGGGCGSVQEQSQVPPELLRVVLALEMRSAHPIARAVAQFCATALKRGSSHLGEVEVEVEGDGGALELSHLAGSPAEYVNDDDVETVAGKGIRLVRPADRGGDVLVGSSSWLEREHGCTMPPAALEVAESLRSGGKVAVFVAQGGRLALVLGLADRVRKEAALTVAALARMGIITYMVTGDNARTAAAIGRAVGIAPEYIFAGAKPEDKENFIAALQTRGLLVGFVGDGTNDSPALARANVGFALGGGTDLAIDAGDVVIYNNELPSLVTAIELSKATMRRIHINYFWALVYNCLLVPLAAGVLFPSFGFELQPMYAGAAMAASSVSVVLSSLCLLLFKPSMRGDDGSAPGLDKNGAAATKKKKAGTGSSSSSDASSESDGLLCECPASSGGQAAAAAAVAAAAAASSMGNGVARKIKAMVTRGGVSSGSSKALDVASVLRSAAPVQSTEREDVEAGYELPAILSLLGPGSQKLSCGCGKGNCRCGAACGCSSGPAPRL